jgi:hypothetical protein
MTATDHPYQEPSPRGLEVGQGPAMTMAACPAGSLDRPASEPHGTSLAPPSAIADASAWPHRQRCRPVTLDAKPTLILSGFPTPLVVWFHLFDMVGRCLAEAYKGTCMANLELAVVAAFALLLVGCASSDRFSDHDPLSYSKVGTVPSSPTTKVVTAPLPPTPAVQPQPGNAQVSTPTRGTINHHEPSLD